MKIVIRTKLTDYAYCWGSDGACFFKIKCDVCPLSHTMLCDSRFSIIKSLNITSFPYILNTDNYPEYFI